MACCLEFQTNCLKVVNIGYLKEFVGTNIQDSTNGYPMPINYSDDSYCPTYEELTGGTLVQNWMQGSTPNGDIDGIIIGGSYASNQLVRQEDLSMKYTRFDAFYISSSSSDVDACGGNESISYVHRYKRYTKSMNSSCSVSTDSGVNAIDSNNSEITWSKECDWVSINTSTLVAAVSSQPAVREAERRCCSVTGSVNFRGSNHTSSTDICQAELTGSWNFSGTSYYNLTTTASTTSFGCCGGGYGINGTGYYYDRYYWVDICGRKYLSSPYKDVYGQEELKGGGGTVSCSITGIDTFTNAGGTAKYNVQKSSSGGGYYVGGTFPAADCCYASNPNCCDGRYDSDTLTISWHGLSKSYNFSQSCSTKTSGCLTCPDDEVYGPNPCGEGIYGKRWQTITYYRNGRPDSTGTYCIYDTIEGGRFVDCGDPPAEKYRPTDNVARFRITDTSSGSRCDSLYAPIDTLSFSARGGITVTTADGSTSGCINTDRWGTGKSGYDGKTGIIVTADSKNHNCGDLIGSYYVYCSDSDFLSGYEVMVYWGNYPDLC